MRQSSFALCVFVLALLCRLAGPFGVAAAPGDPLAHAVICAQSGSDAPAAPDAAPHEDHCAYHCGAVAAPAPPGPAAVAAPVRAASRVAWISRDGAAVLARIARSQSARGPPVLL